MNPHNMSAKIALGQALTTVVLPDGTDLPIKRMPVSKELLFLPLWEGFAKYLEDSKDEIISQFKAAVSAGTEEAAALPVSQGLSIVSTVLSKIPGAQKFLMDGVQVILDAQKVTVNGDLCDLLGTADCLFILEQQMEAQGLLAIFRKFLPGFNSPSQ